jgi:hypothetical protein
MKEIRRKEIRERRGGWEAAVGEDLVTGGVYTRD